MEIPETSKRNRILNRMNSELEKLKDNFSSETVESIQSALPDLADKLSAYSPHQKPVPSYVEKLLEKIEHEPPVNEIFGGPKPGADLVEQALSDRVRVVEEAQRSNTKVDAKTIARMVDNLCNGGFSVPELQLLAAYDVSPKTLTTVENILKECGVVFPKQAHLEALAAAARGILKYIMTSHKCDYKKVAHKTPYDAWRTRDYIQDALRNFETVRVNHGDWDSTNQLNEFKQNFGLADIVLWNKDIWESAIKGYSEFRNTPVTNDLLCAAKPMFWQFDSAMTLVTDIQPLSFRGVDYECAGFCILPTEEDFVKVSFPEDKVKHFERGGQDYIRLDRRDPEVGKIAHDAMEEGVRFKRQGFSIGIIYISGNAVPEIRFAKPYYEDDLIDDRLVAVICAGLKFLTLKYVAKDSTTIRNKDLKQDRDLFRKVRKGKVNVPPITIINLRRSELKHRYAPQDGKRKLNCHYIRSGHWRNQWYPATETHKIIRIDDMLVGDTSKPFRPPKKKVYKAVR